MDRKLAELARIAAAGDLDAAINFYNMRNRLPYRSGSLLSDVMDLVAEQNPEMPRLFSVKSGSFVPRSTFTTEIKYGETHIIDIPEQVDFYDLSLSINRVDIKTYAHYYYYGPGTGDNRDSFYVRVGGWHAPRDHNDSLRHLSESQSSKLDTFINNLLANCFSSPVFKAAKEKDIRSQQRTAAKTIEKIQKEIDIHRELLAKLVIEELEA